MKLRSFLLSAAALPLATLPAFGSTDDKIVVMKSPSCGCCGAWVARLEASGLQTETRNVSDDTLWTMKDRLGITPGLSSCHTAMVGAYVLEGHVPPADIQRLLSERPDALGLTVPGMPIGSPGMEMGDEVEPFDTLLIRADGTTEVFAHHS